VEIVNPELHLVTLDSPDAELNMDLIVERGKGYVSAEQREGLAIGTIPVDSIFSPVRRVNFIPEHTRIGQVTTMTAWSWISGLTAPSRPKMRFRGHRRSWSASSACSPNLGRPPAHSDKPTISTAVVSPGCMRRPLRNSISRSAYNC